MQKTQLAFTAAKLYTSNLVWVTRQRGAACLSPGTDSPKLGSLEKSDSLQVQSKKVFPFPMASAHLFVGSSEPRLAAAVPGLLPPSGCAAKGNRSVIESIRILSVLHKFLPSRKPIFSEVKNSYQLLSGLKPEKNWFSHHMHKSDMINLPGDFLLCHSAC